MIIPLFRRDESGVTLRHLKVMAIRQPAVEESVEPPYFQLMMHGALRKVLGARTSAHGLQTRVSPRGPSMHHGAGDVRVKLQTKGTALAKRLDWKIATFGQKFAAVWKFKSLAMPLVHVAWPFCADL